MERDRQLVRAAEQAKRAEAERKAVADAQKTVAIWNVRQAGGRALWFYPTIGAAIAAGLPWLSFSCPACGQWDSFASARSTGPDGRVSRVNYSGPTGGLLTPDEQCACAVQNCTR